MLAIKFKEFTQVALSITIAWIEYSFFFHFSKDGYLLNIIVWFAFYCFYDFVDFVGFVDFLSFVGYFDYFDYFYYVDYFGKLLNFSR